ncbi:MULTISPECIES: RNA-guided endonuclease TnpB family protein [unclassified Okeania]|uniref:RNA-guided endonuclease InsQ/TnpB family protein n=1 Tax=unclassified Okeania TaxID=2634635 RepID=UPI00257AD044|nr:MULTISPECIES: RNA-guided endonuclease TnpB family protein [unclassified Okeania]
MIFNQQALINNYLSWKIRGLTNNENFFFSWSMVGQRGDQLLTEPLRGPSLLAKIHARIANIRKDAIHKLTTYLAKNHSIIKIEDLQIKAFLKNHKLAGAIADCGMYEFRCQLEYKTEKFSSQLVLVDRMFPSSQICSNCGNHRHQMPLKNRVYICPDCGHIEDKDLNASKNIER